jgi:hypothetical protein
MNGLINMNSRDFRSRSLLATTATPHSHGGVLLRGGTSRSRETFRVKQISALGGHLHAVHVEAARPQAPCWAVQNHGMSRGEQADRSRDRGGVAAQSDKRGHHRAVLAPGGHREDPHHECADALRSHAASELGVDAGARVAAALSARSWRTMAVASAWASACCTGVSGARSVAGAIARLLAQLSLDASLDELAYDLADAAQLPVCEFTQLVELVVA